MSSSPIVAALATSLHHSSRGQKKARAGEEESETKYTAKFRTTPPPQPVLFSLYDEEHRLGGGLPAWQSRRGHRSSLANSLRWCTLMLYRPSLANSLPWCPLLLYLSRRWWTSWWPCMVKHFDSVVAEQIVAVPKISWPSRFPRTFLREPQAGGSACPCSLLQRLGPLGGDLQAHGSYVAWWLRMVPHRQPRAVYKYWARTSSTPLVPCSLCSSSSTEWWKSVVAAVPTITHSANCAVLGSAG